MKLWNRYMAAAAISAGVLASSPGAVLAEQKYSLRVLTQFSPGNSDSNYADPIMSRSGMVAGVNSDGFPLLYQPLTGTTATISSQKMQPVGINASGDIVGISQVYSNNKYNRYLFYLPVGGSPTTLASLNQDYTENYGIFINDSKAVAVINGKAIKFLQGTSVVSTVTLGAGQEFTNNLPEAALLPSGDLLAKMTNVGTAQWFTIKSSGVISGISTSVISASARFMRIQNDGTVLFSTDTDIFSSDLVNAPTSLKGVITSKNNGSAKELTPTLINSSLDSIGVPTDPRFAVPSANSARAFLVEHNGQGHELACTTKQQDTYAITAPIGLSDTGSVLSYISDKTKLWSSTTTYGLLERNENGTNLMDHCARLVAKVVGACAKYYNADGSLKNTLPSKKVCDAVVSVHTANLKPLSGGRVVVDSYPQRYRGKTNSKGTLQLSFNTSVYPYSIRLIAPFGDKKNLSRVVEIPLYKNTP